jgi:hypothetical protein
LNDRYGSRPTLAVRALPVIGSPQDHTLAFRRVCLDRNLTGRRARKTSCQRPWSRAEYLDPTGNHLPSAKAAARMQKRLILSISTGGARQMSQDTTVEQRVTALEIEVDGIKRQLQQPGNSAHWLDEIAGSMKDHPDFEELVRLGRKFRQSQTDSN